MYLGIIVLLIIVCIVNFNCIVHSKILGGTLISLYKNVYDIDLSDCTQTKFLTFNEFFTRPCYRPISNGKQDLVSPVDGEITTYGPIKKNTLLQAKGKRYNLKDLIQIDIPKVQYEYATFYLHPKNYHRVHLPYDAKLIGYKDINGLSLPVNMLAINNLNGIYTNNTRSILVFDVNGYTLIVVLVGAMFVDSIQHITKLGTYKKGDEIAKFNLGSTVIMIYDKDLFELSDTILYKVRARQSIGNIKNNYNSF